MPQILDLLCPIFQTFAKNKNPNFHSNVFFSVCCRMCPKSNWVWAVPMRSATRIYSMQCQPALPMPFTATFYAKNDARCFSRYYPHVYWVDRSSFSRPFFFPELLVFWLLSFSAKEQPINVRRLFGEDRPVISEKMSFKLTWQDNQHLLIFLTW